MHSAHSYVPLSSTKARSRSPSPRPGRSQHLDQNQLFNNTQDLLNPLLQTTSEGLNDSKAESSNAVGLGDSLPLDAIVTISRNHAGHTEDSPQPPQRNSSHRTFPTGVDVPRELDEMAAGMRNYGSISSESGAAGDEAHGSTASLSEGFNISQILSSKSPRLARQKSSYTPDMVDELRKRNKLYFLDPITKLRNFHGFPWKLTLQILKVVLITVQIVIFGDQRENTVEYFERSELTYRHLLLKDWNVAYETLPYPPAAGQYAVYNMSELFDHMNAVMERYYKIPEWSLAAIQLNKDKVTKQAYPITLCFRANDFEEFPNGSYVVSATVMHNCTEVHPLGVNGTRYDIQSYLKEQNFSLHFNRTLDITITFFLRTFHLNLIETHYGPTCYNVSINVGRTKDQMDRWAEYFELLLNRPAPEVPPDIQPSEMELDINSEIPSKVEIRQAINLLKEGKAAGPDGIPAEAIRANINISTDFYYIEYLVKSGRPNKYQQTGEKDIL